jgi:hypothetical protein
LHLQLSQLVVVMLVVLHKFLVTWFEHRIITTKPQSVPHHQVAQAFQLHSFKTKVLMRRLVRHAHAKLIVKFYLVHVYVEVVGAEM